MVPEIAFRGAWCICHFTCTLVILCSCRLTLRILISYKPLSCAAEGLELVFTIRTGGSLNASKVAQVRYFPSAQRTPCNTPSGTCNNTGIMLNQVASPDEALDPSKYIVIDRGAGNSTSQRGLFGRGVLRSKFLAFLRGQIRTHRPGCAWPYFF